MSTVPDFRRVNKQDMPDAPKSINPFVDSYNLFAEQTVAALNGGLDFTNIRGSLVTTTFLTPANYSDGTNANFTSFVFPITFSGARSVVIGSLAVNSSNYTLGLKPLTIPLGGWREMKSGQITVYYITGLSSSTNYKATFLVF